VDELSLVTNPILSLEMLVVRLLHIKAMPSYENLLNSLKESNVDEFNNNPTIELTKKKVNNNEENKTIEQSKDQIKNTVQTKPVLSSSEEKNLSTNLSREKVSSFEDLIYLASKKREIQLKYDLERNVNLIKFSEGKIDISFNQKLDKNFVRNLSARLVEWTGNRWVITLSKEVGNKTFLEKAIIKKKEILKSEKNSELYKKFKDIFSDVELLEIKKRD
jgi:DNA polymerase-3 subunit gamma/tau